MSSYQIRWHAASIDFGSLLCALFSPSALNGATAFFLSAVSAALFFFFFYVQERLLFFAALCGVAKKPPGLLSCSQTLYTKCLFVRSYPAVLRTTISLCCGEEIQFVVCFGCSKFLWWAHLRLIQLGLPSRHQPLSVFLDYH